MLRVDESTTNTPADASLTKFSQCWIKSPILTAVERYSVNGVVKNVRN